MDDYDENDDNYWDAIVNEYQDEEGVEQPPRNVATARAAVRWRAGSLAWSENQYQVQTQRRARSASYKARQRARWAIQKAKYNEQRKERRVEAREDRKRLGFIVSDNGRPKNPPSVAAVPLEVNRALNTDQMVFLAKEGVFEALRQSITVPVLYTYKDPTTGEEDTAALADYLKTPTINIEDKPLSWGMFVFLSWKELRATTRYNYVSNARSALKDAGYLSPENDENVKKYLLYLSSRDDDIHKDDDVADVDEGEQDVFEDIDAEPAPAVSAVVKKKRKNIYTQNPIAIVDFMLAVGVDAWKCIALTYETAQNNNRASGLASVCYAYLRMLYEKEEYKSDKFNIVLEWSEIFRKYTAIARQHTGEKHSQQIANPEDIGNTVPWDTWREKSMAFIRYYLNVDGINVSVKDKINPKRQGYTWSHGPRPKGANNKPPPWLDATNTDDVAPRRPNLRELRDVAIVAVYSLIAPIRLDWAPVEVVEKKPAANQHDSKNRVLVDSVKDPKQLTTAFFGQFKNKTKFYSNPLGFPLPKFVSRESPLCAAILLVYLQERRRQGFVSHCLFPFNTPKSNILKDDTCFNNVAFGARLQDLTWDITGKDFRETLIRRSYLTWYWEQPDHDPLKNETWEKLLPTVHQTSSKISLGYIKKSSAELDKWRADNPQHTPSEERDFLKTLREGARAELVQNVAEQEADEEVPLVEVPPVKENVVVKKPAKAKVSKLPPPPPPAVAVPPVVEKPKPKETSKPKPALKKVVKAQAIKKVASPPPPTTRSGRVAKRNKFFD